MINGHGGNIYDMARQLGCATWDIIDMSSNVNPLGPPLGLADFLRAHMDAILALPQVDSREMVKIFADRHNIDASLVLAGNGTTQFIYTIPKALETKKACILGPTYADYADACAMHGRYHEYLISHEDSDFKMDMDHIQKGTHGFDTVFICNPNNPTGVLIPGDDLEKLCRSQPDTYFVIDESYLPFADDSDRHSMLNRRLSNVVVLNSMSKIFRVPGLRIGFLIASEKIIEKFERHVLPWSVNSLAQLAVSYLMERKSGTDAFVENTRAFLAAERKGLGESLRTISDMRLFPSTTSFILIRLPENQRAEEVCAHFARKRTLIRNCANFAGLSDRFIRISLKTRENNVMAAEMLLNL
ncbi:MAG: hypothetical protein B6245_07125 [Desulfobacteraceae bacterium 4572_88]|nr:MAG: hypothetical protein B6245_07125 [Desulfobacteraceae bacterium 4572_88]